MIDLSRLGRRLASGRVEEAAACARALTALAGREGVEGRVSLFAWRDASEGASRMTRAALTARLIASQDPVPWPSAVMRQLEPSDPAFLPPLAVHPVFAARDRTVIGLAGHRQTAWVDATGWCGVGDGPSVAVWFGEGRRGWPIGRAPSEHRGDAPEVVQERHADGLAIVTRCVRGGLSLELTHWPLILDGHVAFGLLARLELTGPAPRPARLAFAIRPATHEGASPIFRLSRDSGGLWSAGGIPVVAVARPGDEVMGGIYGEPDPWLRFSGAVLAGRAERTAELDLRCPVGMASAVEVHRTTLSPGEPFRRLAIIAPPPGVPSTLARTSARRLREGAIADAEGLLASGTALELEYGQRVLVAGRQRLLLAPARGDLAAIMAAQALTRLGFARRASERLGAWLDTVRRDGRYPGHDGEEGAVLAWAVGQYVRFTQDMDWLRDHEAPLRRLLDHLSRESLAPGGKVLFGADGSPRWSTIWRTAALLCCASALRDRVDGHTEWAIAAAREREGLEAALGPAPWGVAPERAAGGASAALLAACWLGLIPHDHAAVEQTARYLDARHRYGGGVLLHGGAHTAATVMLEVVMEQLEPGRDAVGCVAALASPTGALPTARHPERGALGEGDDLLSAALFVLLALDRLRPTRGVLTLLPGLRWARDLPTPFGRVDVERAQVTGRWWGPAPRVRTEAASGDPVPLRTED